MKTEMSGESNEPITCKCSSPTPQTAEVAAESEQSLGWQSDKCCMKQRFGFIFNSKRYSDITFVVGQEPNVQKIPAHKVVLTVGSKVFEVMFQENWASADNEIELADTDPTAFLALLRYLYTDEIMVTTSTVVSVLNLARNFNIFALEKGCINFFVENLNPENAFALLNQAVQYQEQELFTHCLKVIDDHTLDTISTNDFCKVNDKVLSLILRRDALRVCEIDLFEAVVRWSKAECKRRNMSNTLLNQQAVLRELLPLIRFPLISPEDFGVKVALSGVLSEKQMAALFLYFQGIPHPNFSFSSMPRRGPRKQLDISESRCSNANTARMFGSPDSKNVPSKNSSKQGSHSLRSEMFVVKRFASTQNKWVYIGGFDEIGFSLDRDVNFKGIKLYDSKMAGENYQVSVTLMQHETNTPLYNTQTFHTSNGRDETYKVVFNSPVSLVANNDYVLRVSIEGTPSLYGCGGSKRVITSLESGKDITISFFDVVNKKNPGCRTGVNMGQIPELCFEL